MNFKKLAICISISLLLHASLLLVKFSAPAAPSSPPVKIDIIPKEPQAQATPPPPATPPVVAESTPPPVRPKPQPTPPKEVIPETPAEPDLPAEVAEPIDPVEPKPAQPETQPATPAQPAAITPIVPRQYNPDNPPAPMSLKEMLQEQQNAQTGATQPDRNMQDVVREQLAKDAKDDSVSFTNIEARYESYFYKFARAVYGEWKYPRAAAGRGEQGIVRVTFSIAKDGKIMNINLLETSGYQDLDREVLRMLRALPPVPLPESYEPAMLNINGFFIYSQSGQYRLY
jgi:protein TonB